MDCSFQEGGYKAWTADALLSFVSDGCDIVPAKHDLDNACPWLVVAPALRDVRSKKYALHMVHGHPEGAIKRVLFLGVGSLPAADDEDESPLDIFRLAVAKAVRRCQELDLETLLIPLSELEKLPYGTLRLVEELAYAANLALYRGDFFKTKAEAHDFPKRLCLGVTQRTTDLEQALARGIMAAEATMRARTLANTPANHLTPVLFAEKAQEIASAAHLTCRIYDETELAMEGFNALLAVGQGSIHPPRMVILSTEAKSETAPIVLVGKGICFDSGGISLKPAAKMHEMKSDMSGAAAVLAALVAYAHEAPNANIIGILALAENMPDGGAVRPGDVVRAHNGETIEITNTDAEGRMVLCDALDLAQTYKPRAIVDIATLTGACAVALGNQVAGLFCEDASLHDALISSGETAGEYLWPLPLWKGYRKKLKSEIADICHTGPRQGGAINAALFLRHFVQIKPYAHLDIAGVDWNDEAQALCPKGATGFGARLLLEFLRGGFK